MKKNRHTYFILFIILAITGCYGPSHYHSEFQRSRSFQEVVQSKRLVLGTTLNPISLYSYKQSYLGYEYEFARIIASKLKAKLEVKIANTDSSLFEMLKTGEIDLLANGCIHLPEQKKLGSYCFSEPTLKGNAGVLTDAPKGIKDSLYWHKMLLRKIKLPYSNWLQIPDVEWKCIFSNSRIYFPEDTSSKIPIVKWYESDSSSIVTGTDIEYVLLDLHELTDKRFVKSEKAVELGFLVNPSSNWIDTLNILIQQISNSRQGLKLSSKYLKSTQISNQTTALTEIPKASYVKRKGSISMYDDLIREASSKHNWDWRFVAAIIQKESNFTPNAQSPYGAKGLMQLVSGTGKRFGATNLFDPVQNVDAGVQYLNYLRNFWQSKIQDPAELNHFVLASYNSGLGHIIDARKLAEKYNANPNVWNDNVAAYLLKKAEPTYYKDPVCKLGYCKGKETIAFVQSVMTKYQEYQLISP